MAGPTGSGKSDLALRIAEKFDGEIINCDSLQVYRHFDIGTAKLPLEERRGIPHHLIDILDPDELCTAGAYARLARNTIARNFRHAAGFRFWREAPAFTCAPCWKASLKDRSAISRSATVWRHARTAARDRCIAFSADSIPLRPRRFTRMTFRRLRARSKSALLTRQPVSRLFQQGRDALTGYRTLKFGLLPDRETLNPRLDARCAWMFDHGLVEEVRHILALGFSPECKPFESHGYKQAIQLIHGELNARDAVFYAQRNTRHYAKRQITWFRGSVNSNG